MTPEEIADAYNVVAENIKATGAQEAAKIGNSQRSLGLMAERVASPSGQTSGLANYTYDRTLRPTINSLATSLVTEGKVNALSEFLRNELSKAKQNYENASAAAAANSNNNNGNTLLNEITDNAYNPPDGASPNAQPGSTFSVADNGNGTYDVVTPDGTVNGAYRQTINTANSAEEAINKYKVIAVGQVGERLYDVVTADGKRHEVVANSPEAAKNWWYKNMPLRYK